MTRQPIGLHAVTHLPNGSDPLTFNAQGLPLWFSWIPFLHFPTGFGGITAPTLSVQFAYIMAQTVDGTPENTTGLPANFGTLLSVCKVTLTSAGAVASPYANNAVILVRLTDNSGYFPLPESPGTNPPHAIGGGWIRQASTGTIHTVQLLTDGSMMIPNVPDFADLSGASSPSTQHNLARLANTVVSPNIPAWPWAWTTGDQISLYYLSPIGVGG